MVGLDLGPRYKPLGKYGEEFGRETSSECMWGYRDEGTVGGSRKRVGPRHNCFVGRETEERTVGETSNLQVKVVESGLSDEVWCTST